MFSWYCASGPFSLGVWGFLNVAGPEAGGGPDAIVNR